MRVPCCTAQHPSSATPAGKAEEDNKKAEPHCNHCSLLGFFFSPLQLPAPRRAIAKQGICRILNGDFFPLFFIAHRNVIAVFSLLLLTCHIHNVIKGNR